MRISKAAEQDPQHRVGVRGGAGDGRRAAARPPIDGPSPAILAKWLTQAQNSWLFDKIEGDYFAILGLSLIPLLDLLRRHEALPL